MLSWAAAKVILSIIQNLTVKRCNNSLNHQRGNGTEPSFNRMADVLKRLILEAVKKLVSTII